MKKYMKVLIALVLLIAAIFVSVVLWSFWEPSDIQKGSFAYRLKVTEDAQTFPVWNQVSVPKYDVNIADGEKPSATILRYDSSLMLGALMDKARIANFSCQQFEPNAAICDKDMSDGRSQQLLFQKDSDEKYSQVKVLFIGY